jgi:hypothetical protein
MTRNDMPMLSPRSIIQRYHSRVSLLAWHWVLVGASPVFAILFLGNQRDKALTIPVWGFLIALAAVDIVILLTTPRPAPARVIAAVAVVWGLLPPAYFYAEWVVWRLTTDEQTRRRDFSSFKYAQDMGARVWSAVGIVLAFLAQLALSRPHA